MSEPAELVDPNRSPSPETTEAAVLDRAGTIMAVTSGWEAFCVEHGGDQVRGGVGQSYLEICDSAGDARSDRIAAAVRAATSGALMTPVSVFVQHDDRDLDSWFEVSISSRLDDCGSPRGATVAIRPVPGSMPHHVPECGDTLDFIAAWELLEAAPDGMVLVDESGCIAYANSMAVELTGYPREALLGASIEMLVPESSRLHHQEHRNAFGSDAPSRMMGSALQLALQRCDGTELPVEISLASVRIGGIAMMSASIRDVSEQREADQARQRLHRILDLGSDAVFIADAQTAKIEYANSGAAELLGYTREELTSMSYFDITPHASPESRIALLEEHRQKGPEYRHAIEVVRRAKDGTNIPCDSHAQVVRTVLGAEQFIIVDRDARSRLAEEALQSRRADLGSLVGWITSMVLADTPDDVVYQHLVEGVSFLLDSESVSMVLLDHGTGIFEGVAATGPVSQLHHEDQSWLNHEFLLLWSGREGAFALAAPPPTMAELACSPVGPMAIAHFPGAEPVRGLITAAREKGREEFVASDVELLAEIARQVATVVELGHARADRQQLAIRDDRERIARDLHDTVIQDLIGIGMQLGTGTNRPGGEALDQLRDDIVDTLDESVRKLRTIVFGTRDVLPGRSVTDSLRAVAAEAERVLGHEAIMTFVGPVDDLPCAVTRELLPVLREALSNVARHADATVTEASVSVGDGTVLLVVRDDGIGIAPDAAPGNGSGNFRSRAALLSGTVNLTSPPSGGTLLEWMVRTDGSGELAPNSRRLATVGTLQDQGPGRRPHVTPGSGPSSGSACEHLG